MQTEPEQIEEPEVISQIWSYLSCGVVMLLLFSLIFLIGFISGWHFNGGI